MEHKTWETSAKRTPTALQPTPISTVIAESSFFGDDELIKDFHNQLISTVKKIFGTSDKKI